MPLRATIRQRKRIFVAAEGESERSFARWLQHLCEDQKLSLHLDIAVAGGGDTRRVVEFAVRRRRRNNERRGRDSGAFVLLDADRLDADCAAGRNPNMVQGLGNWQLVFLKPNLEGLLVRLHKGRERRDLAPKDASRHLRDLWPEYIKTASADMLQKRFDLDDLQRAAEYDDDLKSALTLLGLQVRRRA